MASQSDRPRFCCPARRDQMHAKREWSCFHPSSGMQASSPVQWAPSCVLLRPTALLSAEAEGDTLLLPTACSDRALVARAGACSTRPRCPRASSTSSTPSASPAAPRLPWTDGPGCPTQYSPANTHYGVAGRTASSLCAHLQ